jgi:predicted ATPase
MITRIEALNYRCLKYIRQDLGPLHVLVGPNASGKTTFLDVVAFLGTLVTDGPEDAVLERTQNFDDLVWGRHGDRFELAIQALIPERLRPDSRELEYDTVRYEVAIGRGLSDEISVLHERVILETGLRLVNGQTSRGLFPESKTAPESLCGRKSQPNTRLTLPTEVDE